MVIARTVANPASARGRIPTGLDSRAVPSAAFDRDDAARQGPGAGRRPDRSRARPVPRGTRSLRRLAQRARPGSTTSAASSPRSASCSTRSTGCSTSTTASSTPRSPHVDDREAGVHRRPAPHRHHDPARHPEPGPGQPRPAHLGADVPVAAARGRRSATTTRGSRRARRTIPDGDLQSELFKAMHPMGATLSQECVVMMGEAMCTPLFHNQFRVPDLPGLGRRRRRLVAPSTTSTAASSSTSGGTSPATAGCSRPAPTCGASTQLLATYPDARIVFTHRDPVKSMTSYASLTTLVRSHGQRRRRPVRDRRRTGRPG